MNIFLFELKNLRKSIIVWSASLVALCFFFMSLFPSMVANAEAVKQLFQGYPPQVLAAISVNVDKIASIEGFYPFSFLYVLFGGIICALIFGLGAASRENRTKTTDFLLSKPISRAQVMTAKLLAILCAIVIINLVYVAGSTAICLAYAKGIPVDVKALVMTSLIMFWVQLAMASLGVAIAVFWTRIKSVPAVSLSIAFLFFAITFLEGYIDPAVVKYMTPFKFFDASLTMATSSYETSSLLWVAGICIVSIAAAYVWFIKQDTRSV